MVYSKIRLRDTEALLDEEDLVGEVLDEQERDLQALPDSGPLAMELGRRPYSWLEGPEASLPILEAQGMPPGTHHRQEKGKRLASHVGIVKMIKVQCGSYIAALIRSLRLLKSEALNLRTA